MVTLLEDRRPDVLTLAVVTATEFIDKTSEVAMAPCDLTPIDVCWKAILTWLLVEVCKFCDPLDTAAGGT